MLRLERVSVYALENLIQMCGLEVPDHGIGWVFNDPDSEGLISYAVVSDNNIILSFGTRPDMRGQHYARMLMDMLTTQYDKLSVAILHEDPVVEAALLGSGFRYDGDNVLKYVKEG